MSDENIRPRQAPRKRPLRTYGRRAQPLPDRDTEPPRKKRAFEDNGSDDTPIKESCLPSSPQLPKLTAQLPAPVSVKRGSILAFFKPITPSTSSSTPKSQISSDATREEVVASSPPSSPPLLSRPVKRRLATRINSVGKLREEAGQKATEPHGRETAKQGVVAEKDDAEESSTAMSRPSSVLQELKPSLLNSSIIQSEAPAESGFKVKHEAKRRARKPTVQTTLNLSLADEPGFTICKECDMLYNPLNEKDRRDHKKQHAAALRKKGGVTLEARDS
jgi:hypothetical protein